MNEIAGPAVTQSVQLGIEYDPKPPFAAGSPSRAPAEIKATVDQRYAPRLPEFEKILDRVAPRLRAAG
jgi:cyclohexyl-isocyanide hydratase